MRKVFGDQIRPVLIERIERHYSHAAQGPANELTEKATRQDLIDLVDRSISIFQRDGKQKASKFVDEFEIDHEMTGPGHIDTTTLEMALIAQIREYLVLSDRVFNQTVPDLPDLDPGPVNGGRQTVVARASGEIAGANGERQKGPGLAGPIPRKQQPSRAEQGAGPEERAPPVPSEGAARRGLHQF